MLCWWGRKTLHHPIQFKCTISNELLYSMHCIALFTDMVTFNKDLCLARYTVLLACVSVSVANIVSFSVVNKFVSPSTLY